jgi:hypothetical protein
VAKRKAKTSPTKPQKDIGKKHIKVKSAMLNVPFLSEPNAIDAAEHYSNYKVDPFLLFKFLKDK